MRSVAEVRDQKLLDGVMKHKYIIPEQAAELFFTTIKNKEYRDKKAAIRLLKLYQKKLVNRFRIPGDPFVYTVTGNKYSTKMIHYLAITDVLIQIIKLLPSSSVIEYEVEQDNGNVITDLYLSYRNDFRHESGQYFIEVELDSSRDILEKIPKYEDLISKEKISSLHKLVERTPI